MKQSRSNGRFFLPGPTEVDNEILAAMLGPMIGHRTPEMEALNESVQRNLRMIFRTARPVYMSASSATGLMEAAIRNGVRKKVLCLVNGAFSDRFHKIAQACGVQAIPLNVEMGQYHSPELLREELAKDDYDAVTVVHSETSTGVLNPIEALAKVVHEKEDRLILVDSVSGLGGVPVESDAWKLDFILTGSQKALALPAGLAFGVAQESILKRAQTLTHRGVYFDFIELEKHIKGNQTPNTPALSLLYAADVQFKRIAAETIEKRWARHAQMAERTAQWIDEMCRHGTQVYNFAPQGYRSPTVTCVGMPPGGKTGAQVAKEMQARSYTVSPGYGSLKDKTFRIGHMGDHTLEELNELLDVLAAVITA
jgi:aspartate aminotransferase-like enzyme